MKTHDLETEKNEGPCPLQVSNYTQVCCQKSAEMTEIWKISLILKFTSVSLTRPILLKKTTILLLLLI